MSVAQMASSAFRFFDQLPIGVLVLSRDFTARFWNRCLEDWTGVSRDQVVGVPIGERFAEFDRPELKDRIRPVFAGGPPVILSSRLHQQLVPARLFNGQSCLLDTTVAAIADGEGEFQALFSFQDVTELTRRNQRYREVAEQAKDELQRRQQAEQQLQYEALELQRSNRELDQFAYVASHDLREPLRSVDNLSKWIAEDLGTENLPEATRRHLRQLRQQVRRMETLLDDLLQYSRAGRDSSELLPVNLGKLSREVVQLFDWPEHFRVVIDENMPTITTAKIPLETCLRNLIGNAIKHHDREGGLVQVSSRDIGSFIELIVVDDGPGIAPEFHGRIFNMFQTLRPRDEGKGSGMGLAIIKKIVETQGGSITVDSSEGQGAKFCLLWPKSLNRRDQQACAIT